MTLVLELNAEEEALLHKRAEESGLDEAAYVKRLIHNGNGIEHQNRMTPAEAVEYWRREGVLGTFADRPDSPEFARQLREQASKRDRD